MALETQFIDLTADPVDLRRAAGGATAHIAVQNLATTRCYFAWSMDPPDTANGGHVLGPCGWATLSALPSDQPPVWFWSTASGGGRVAVSRAAPLL